jgi:hypothetical protein
MDKVLTEIAAKQNAYKLFIDKENKQNQAQLNRLYEVYEKNWNEYLNKTQRTDLYKDIFHDYNNKRKMNNYHYEVIPNFYDISNLINIINIFYNSKKTKTEEQYYISNNKSNLYIDTTY